MVKKLPGILLNMISWLVSTQFVIAFSALCLALETMVLAGIVMEPGPVLGFIFFGSLTVYNLAFLGSDPLCYSLKKRQNYLTCIISFLIATGFLFFLPFSTILFVILSGLLTVLYLYKISWRSYTLQVRNIPLVKNLLLAIIWGVATVFIPLSVYQNGVFFNENEWLIFLRRFFFILAIAIPYDIRDYKEDKLNRLQTLPVAFGVGITKIISIISLVCFALLVLYNTHFPHSGNDPLAKTATAFYISTFSTAALILLANTARKKYFFSLLLDGTMILQFALVLVTLKAWGAAVW